MLSIPCPIFFKVDWIYATCNQQVSVCPFFFDTVSQNHVSLPLFIYSTSNLYNEKLNKFLCFNFYDYNTFTCSIVWIILYSIDANLKNIGHCFLH